MVPSSRKSYDQWYLIIPCVENIKEQRAMESELIGKLQTFARHNCTYLIYDVHMSNIRIHCHLVLDINKEKNTKHGYQTETVGKSDRQIILV